MLIFLFSISSIAQQGITLPRASQHATVSQKIGYSMRLQLIITDPVLKTEIFGVLWFLITKYGEQELMRILPSHFRILVKIDGKNVPAGTYGLHMIPTEKEWTIILNKDFRAWGSFFYVEENDLLRFTVNPETADHQEWLTYSFERCYHLNSDNCSC